MTGYILKWVWILFALFVFIFFLVSAVEAALNHRWDEGCFWMLAIIAMHMADKKEKNT